MLGEHRTKALTIARSAEMETESVIQRAEILTQLAPLLADEERDDVLADARAAATQIVHVGMRVMALTSIIPNLPCEARPAALAEVLAYVPQLGMRGGRYWLSCSWYEYRRRASTRERALDVVSQIADPMTRCVALIDAAKRLPRGQTPRAVAIAAGIAQPRMRCHALAMLGAKLPDATRPELHDIWRRALQAAAHAGVESLGELGWYLAKLLPRLLQHAEATRIISDE